MCGGMASLGKKCFWSELRVVIEMTEGERLKQVPEDSVRVARRRVRRQMLPGTGASGVCKMEHTAQNRCWEGEKSKNVGFE